MTFKWPYFGTA